MKSEQTKRNVFAACFGAFVVASSIFLSGVECGVRSVHCPVRANRDGRKVIEAKLGKYGWVVRLEGEEPDPRVEN